MAAFEDIPEGDFDATQQTAGAQLSFLKLTNLLAAGLSLGLVVGVGVWGYKLMVRDVSGIPVVRAVEGPMREQPKDPGGQPADHQGLAVNMVAASGAAADPADRLVLAPKPVVLLDEDTVSNAVPEQESVSQEAEPTVSEAQDDIQVAINAQDIDTLVAQLTKNVAPLDPFDPDDQADHAAEPPVQTTVADVVEEETDVPETADVVLAVVTGPGPKTSIRPVLRPAAVVQKASFVTTQPEAPQALAVPQDVDPDSLASGTKLAQLGAYDSPEVAKQEWIKISAQFSDYMDDKQRVIQKASSGGRTFYRLRAMGFDDLSDARRFCSALVAENADCIPVTTR